MILLTLNAFVYNMLNHTWQYDLLEPTVLAKLISSFNSTSPQFEEVYIALLGAITMSFAPILIRYDEKSNDTVWLVHYIYYVVLHSSLRQGKVLWCYT